MRGPPVGENISIERTMTMKKRLVSRKLALALGFTIIAVCTITTYALSHAQVNDNAAGQFGPPIVGLWKVTITDATGAVILRGFDIYNSDHTEILAEFHDPRTGNVCLG